MIRNSSPRIASSLMVGSTLVLACVLAFMPAAAATEVLQLESTATKVQFTLGSTLHEVHGIFELTGGEIVFDPSTGEASGRVAVSASSGNTENRKRDKKMHNAVLESVTFPEILFIPHRLEGALQQEGTSEVQLDGTMEIHGARHDIVIPATVRMERGKLTGTAQFSIPFVEWGMKDPSVFLFRVKKEVQVTLDLVGAVLPRPAVLPTSVDSQP